MQKKKAQESILNILGPGLITGASDDDPSGIATYSQAGAQFGVATLWMALITFPLMLAVQEMCARIGMVTTQGLTQNIKDNYSKPLLIIVVLLIVPAIILNIAADIASMGAVANLVVPLVPANVFAILFVVILMIGIIFLRYQQIVAVLKYCCLSLFLYFIIPFLVKQQWSSVLKSTVIPTIHLNKEYISIIVAILGTTISPYMFFWQATLGAENRAKNREVERMSRKKLRWMRYDVMFGMLVSNLVMYFIILTTGTILFPHGITQIATVEQAAKALEPLAGEFSYFLFALGVLGTGFLAIPVLGGALSYVLSTVLNLKSGLDKHFYEAKGFYMIIIVSLLFALCINFLGINPIKALVWTAIFYGLTTPVMILFVLHIANNKSIMNTFTNSKTSNVLGWITFLFMFCAALAFFYVQL
jgi:NRAMP (natural resistance-associated macrophage protein)-like metal ion transporter